MDRSAGDGPQRGQATETQSTNPMQAVAILRQLGSSNQMISETPETSTDCTWLPGLCEWDAIIKQVVKPRVTAKCVYGRLLLEVDWVTVVWVGSRWFLLVQVWFRFSLLVPLLRGLSTMYATTK